MKMNLLDLKFVPLTELKKVLKIIDLLILDTFWGCKKFMRIPLGILFGLGSM